MELWNDGIIAFHVLVVKENAAAKPAAHTVSAVGVYLPEGRHPIIPIFQHSIIPIVSAANYVLFHTPNFRMAARTSSTVMDFIQA
jgi:hypothetical protein